MIHSNGTTGVYPLVARNQELYTRSHALRGNGETSQSLLSLRDTGKSDAQPVPPAPVVQRSHPTLTFITIGTRI